MPFVDPDVEAADVTTYIGADLLRAHLPWLTADLRSFLLAVGDMFGEVELFAFTAEGEDSWVVLFDPDLAPAQALPWLAQLRGERLPRGLPEALARERVKDAANMIRGTVESIFYAAQRNLTGQRMVSIRERDGDSDRVTVITYTDQTPDPAQTLADILTVFPADMVLNYEVLPGQAWTDVNTVYATWADVDTEYASWAEVAADQVGATTFTRPAP